MSTQQLVDPGKIEPELTKLWEGLAKEKIRACLFNLIIFNELSCRTDYIRETVRKVSEKYPCRVLFITSDPKAGKEYLKTAISVVGDGNIACDYIDIGVSGSLMERVPFLILPHLIPDLPTALLWTEDPLKDHVLFDPLKKLAHRIIFDSESADSLLDFSQNILKLREENIDTADLNWARTQGWRELIASIFRSSDKVSQIKHVKITYNAEKTEVFYHLKVQSLYILTWLATRLGWKFEKTTKELDFTFENQTAKIEQASWEKMGSGTILSINISTHDGYEFDASRMKDQTHRVIIKTSSPEKCEMPYQFVLGKTATGQSLIKEIINKGTSAHYIEMLKGIQELDKDKLC